MRAAKGVETLLLVGDPKQLPATVVSQDAVRAGLQVSLFERFQVRASCRFTEQEIASFRVSHLLSPFS